MYLLQGSRDFREILGMLQSVFSGVRDLPRRRQIFFYSLYHWCFFPRNQERHERVFYFVMIRPRGVCRNKVVVRNPRVVLVTYRAYQF